MASPCHRMVDPARQGHHRLPLFERPLRSDQGAGRPGSLDDDHHLAEPRDDAVAHGEVVAARADVGRVFGEEQALLSHPRGDFARGPWPIDPAAQHGQGRTAHHERATVRGLVDPAGHTADDAGSGLGQGAREACRLRLTVGGRCARSDDRDARPLGQELGPTP